MLTVGVQVRDKERLGSKGRLDLLVRRVDAALVNPALDCHVAHGLVAVDVAAQQHLRARVAELHAPQRAALHRLADAEQLEREATLVREQCQPLSHAIVPAVLVPLGLLACLVHVAPRLLRRKAEGAHVRVGQAAQAGRIHDAQLRLRGPEHDVVERDALEVVAVEVARQEAARGGGELVDRAVDADQFGAMARRVVAQSAIGGGGGGGGDPRRGETGDGAHHWRDW